MEHLDRRPERLASLLAGLLALVALTLLGHHSLGNRESLATTRRELRELRELLLDTEAALGDLRRLLESRVSVDDGRGLCCRGLTWTAKPQLGELVHVGGHASSDPYRGDTSCERSLPLLCLRQTGQPKPTGLETTYYHGWARGEVRLSRPVAGTLLGSLAVASDRCAEELGMGWRMAEFHDGGGGWNWYAYGSLEPGARFWVHINDQPANPWNSACR